VSPQEAARFCFARAVFGRAAGETGAGGTAGAFFARFVPGGATDGAIAAAAFLAAGRCRAGAEAAASRTLAPGLPAVAGAFLFDDAEEGEPVFFTGAPRDEVFFAAALPSAFARFASGAA